MPTQKSDLPIRNSLRLNPAKLLRSKWTAVSPVNREKHFIVTALIEPEIPDAAPQLISLEAVLTRRRFDLHWHELNDSSRWLQGWR
ncbi:TIGR02450 family Trp-rich protein [Duganella sp. FT94W]|uniref:TIGR02450 family Trp-rich protein n=1 Tax=Duganella lactea TaxID=2692173 RepID=A0ABW9V4E2_9BURK|nr:TIGR02450 family Trp-rich protein [Duganella lactea]MYM34430.1 TIGR02450 family Trp-rich protein [Duganella lactea]